MIEQKIAIILRGTPGSGKSSFVELMKMSHKNVVIHAIDDLHRDSKGNFLWDEENAKRLYTLNFANFVKSCANDKELIVCDAINIEISDFQKYIDIAKQYKYKVYVVTPDLPTPKESSKRNTHHTSALQAKEMYQRWESWPTNNMLKELINEDN
jgi:predicted kinase